MVSLLEELDSSTTRVGLVFIAVAIGVSALGWLLRAALIAQPVIPTAVRADEPSFRERLFEQTGSTANNDAAELDVSSREILAIPALSRGTPAAGQRVKATPPEYFGTQVFHTVYLPKHWQKHGPSIPIIFEYTGNYFPQAGSTGEPEDAALGYGLSDGKYIWVSLPYISAEHTDNAVTWWGDEQATIEYAKVNVPRIIREFGADADAVFLCGFSRGAIGVNYIGLHDDEIAKLWTAFIAHDHFDGVKQWGNTTWGSPLAKYREAALERARRVGDRPYLVSQNGSKYGTEEYLRAILPDIDNFTFNSIDAGEIFGGFPNEFATAPHTDRWLLKPSKYRSRTWEWMNRAASEVSQHATQEKQNQP